MVFAFPLLQRAAPRVSGFVASKRRYMKKRTVTRTLPFSSCSLLELARQIAPVFGARSLVVGRVVFDKDNRLDIAAYCEVADNAHPARFEQCHKFIQDQICGCLMADLPIAEGVDIE